MEGQERGREKVERDGREEIRKHRWQYNEGVKSKINHEKKLNLLRFTR